MEKKTTKKYNTYKKGSILISFGKNDGSIYRHIKKQRHISEYIKDLVLADMKRGDKVE